MYYSGADSALFLETYLNDQWLSKQLCAETIGPETNGEISVELCTGRGRHRIRHGHVNSSVTKYHILDQLQISDVDPNFRMLCVDQHTRNHLYPKAEKYARWCHCRDWYLFSQFIAFVQSGTSLKNNATMPILNGSICAVS